MCDDAYAAAASAATTADDGDDDAIHEEMLCFAKTNDLN